jgi:aldose 1-epimerase
MESQETDMTDPTGFKAPRRSFLATLLGTGSAFALSPLLVACDDDDGDTPAPARDPLVVALERENFQKTVDGKPVDLFTLRNARGSQASITSYGARIEQILVPDRHGVLGDVVLGYESIDAVIGGQASMGAFIGRYANRIANARFTLDGVTHQLTPNSGVNSVHGGPRGSRFQVFDAQQLSPNAVEMRYVFRDGEENFPGTLPVRVVYTLDDDDALTLEWQATAQDKATVANFTGHAFFNLTGDPRVSVVDHLLTVDADRFLPVNATIIPTGELRPVAGTPMDFRTPKRIGQDIAATDEQLRLGNGYDHHYVLNRPAGSTALAFAARAEEPTSGRVLEVWTTEPGLQVFSGNGLAALAPRDLGKGGRLFAFRGGLCLEPSHFPDSPNQPAFPSTVVRPGETYSGRIVYRFSTRGA